MDNLIFKTLLLSSVFLILYGVIRVTWIVWLKPKSLEKLLRQQGIRGNSYKVLYGDREVIKKTSIDVLSKPISLNHRISQRVFPVFHELVQTYGKVCMCWIDTTPRLILADPELIRLVLTNKKHEFGQPPVNPLVRILQRGIPTLEGEKWVTRRRLITPAFHFEELKGMMPAFSKSGCDLINRLKTFVSPKGSCEVDVAPQFRILASDVIARTAFGSSYEEGREIFELQNEQVILVLEAHNSFYFPGLRFIPTKKNRRRYYLDKKIKAILQDMIHKKEQTMESRESEKIDLLGLLIQCKVDQGENGLTMEDIIEECKMFYLAGYETTANLLTWTLIVLSMHQNWQEKAREEVLQICGKKTPDIDGINHLKIVSMILNEVLRLYPPLPAVYRRTLKETNLQGMSIPAGVELIVSILFVHHDPESWGDDVEEFKPERFAEGISKASKDQMTFYPFAWGPQNLSWPKFCHDRSKDGSSYDSTAF